MVSLSRILTKLLLPDERASTLIFFLVSAGLELLCFLLHLLVRRSRFVRHHTVRPRGRRRAPGAGYRVHHDVAAGDVCFVRPPAPLPVSHHRVGEGDGTAPALASRSSPSGPGPPRAGLHHTDRGFLPPWHVCGLGPASKPSWRRRGEPGALWWCQAAQPPEGRG